MASGTGFQPQVPTAHAGEYSQKLLWPRKHNVTAEIRMTSETGAKVQQCVPAHECHPTKCVGKSNIQTQDAVAGNAKPNALMCSRNCVFSSLDCGGYCAFNVSAFACEAYTRDDVLISSTPVTSLNDDQTQRAIVENATSVEEQDSCQQRVVYVRGVPLLQPFSQWLQSASPEGLASYHLCLSGDAPSWISYAHPQAREWKTANGKAFPLRKYFDKTESYEPMERRFRGTMDWTASPVSREECSWLVYDFTLSEELQIISSGTAQCIGTEGMPGETPAKKTWTYGSDLFYINAEHETVDAVSVSGTRSKGGGILMTVGVGVLIVAMAVLAVVILGKLKKKKRLLTTDGDLGDEHNEQILSGQEGN